MASEKLLLILIIAIILGMIVVIKGVIKRKKEIRKREFEQAKRNDMFPIPKHLKDILVLVGEKSSEYRVNGKIRCTCTCECFHVKVYGNTTGGLMVCEYKDGFALVVAVVCKDCGKEYLIFDKSKHGWDGFVCHDGISVPDAELKPWRCPKCSGDIYNMDVFITSPGKQDFIESIELPVAAGETQFSEDEWVEGFDWIVIGLVCCGCGYHDKKWISHEAA